MKFPKKVIDSLKIIAESSTRKRTYLERNPTLISIVINLILIVITIRSVLSSNSNSNISINQTKKSLQLSAKQLILSEKQFAILQAQNIIKDSLQNIKDSIQNRYNENQTKINKSMMNTAKSQADIAKEQYKFQLLVNRDQLYQNRPIFIVQNTSVDSSQSKKDPIINFYILNIGKRPAYIKKRILFIYNERKDYITGNSIPSDIEINEKSTYFSSIQMNNTIYKDPSTLCYIVLFYKDLEAKKYLRKVLLFRWQIKDNSLLASEVPKNDQENFIILLKSLEKQNKDTYYYPE